MKGPQPAPYRTRAVLLLLVSLLGGCDILGDLEEVAPWMTVSPNNITVVEGRVAEIEVRTNIDLYVWDLGWGAVDQSVALIDTIDVKGDSRAIAHVYGVGPGGTDIHFGINAVRQHASATMWVTVQAVTLRSLTLEPESLSVTTGADFWVVPHAKDSVGWELIGQPIDWQISDSTIVSLQYTSGWYSNTYGAMPPGSALFRADKPGMVTITAALEGIRSSSVVYVTEI